jgi:hypothetical protein
VILALTTVDVKHWKLLGRFHDPTAKAITPYENPPETSGFGKGTASAVSSENLAPSGLQPLGLLVGEISRAGKKRNRSG